MTRERWADMLRQTAAKANPHLAAVLGEIAGARDGAPISSEETWRQPAGTPNTLADYMRPTNREPGEEG